MKRLIAAGAVAALTVGVAIPTFATARTEAAKKPAVKKSAGKKGGWAVCREHPILHISPPLTFASSHAATFKVSDVLESCTSSDPTINRGIAYINATTTSDASCNGGKLAGVARIRWNTGRTSRIPFNASFAAGFASASGHIAGGTEFIGQQFAALDHLNIDQVAIQICSTPSIGLSTLASDGVIAIGAPPTVDGMVWAP